jgi:hypothetical protein
MEQDFHNNDLEQLLRNSADGYRMYPSAGVWSNIHERLHGKRKILITGGISLLLLFLLLFMNRESENTSIAANQNPAAAAKNKNKNAGTASTSSTSSPGPSLMRTQNPENSVPRPATHGYLPAPVTVTGNHLAGLQSFARPRRNGNDDPTNIYADNNNVAVAITGTSDENEPADDVVAVTDVERQQPLIQNDLSGALVTQGLEKTARKKLPAAQEPAVLKPIALSKTSLPDVMKQGKPLTVHKPKKPAAYTEYYFTPSISYRRLYDTRLKSTSNVNGDLDNTVNHKPDIGFEGGLAWQIPIDQRIRFRAGVQFNYNRYNIKASGSFWEPTTVINTAERTVTISTPYRNRPDGVFPQWLENTNLQISLPLGFEAAVSGSEKARLHIGATVQPSYLLRDKAYILTSDLKSYAPSEELSRRGEEGYLIRRLNLNAGLEAFITVKSGRTQLRFGPQLRYQLFSSYTKANPIKERLIDYGFKVGFSLLPRR